ncbi:MAG: ABC transporter permease [Acidobacteria bacterium]|nr:ABC transporter permease [Acidobacteriota bacterium]
MSRILIVATFEFMALVRTKAFLIGVLLMPVFMMGTIVFQRVTEKRLDSTTRTFAVVDHTGGVYPVLAAAVEQWNAQAIGPDGAPRAPKFVAREVDPAARPIDELRLQLSDQVRRKELFAFVEVPREALDPARQPAAGVQYHSDHPSYETLPRFLDAAIGRTVLAIRFRAAALDPREIDRLARAPRLENLGLFDRDASGRLTSAEQLDRVRSIAVPAVFMALMFLVVMTSSPQLLNSVMEEKMSRISEVLVSSITPFQLMMGKLLGSAAVSIVLAVVYLLGAYRAAAYWGYADALTPPMVGWFMLFLVCAVLLFGSIFVSIGAACSDFKDAQSMMTPAMLIVMLPIFVWTAVLRAPDSALAVGMSLFPPATPFLMLLRLALRPSPPLWQVLLSVVLVLLTVVAAVWAAGKIFRTGILMHGKSATLGEMLRWVRAS